MTPFFKKKSSLPRKKKERRGWGLAWLWGGGAPDAVVGGAGEAASEGFAGAESAASAAPQLVEGAQTGTAAADAASAEGMTGAAESGAGDFAGTAARGSGGLGAGSGGSGSFLGRLWSTALGKAAIAGGGLVMAGAAALTLSHGAMIYPRLGGLIRDNVTLPKWAMGSLGESVKGGIPGETQSLNPMGSGKKAGSAAAFTAGGFGAAASSAAAGGFGMPGIGYAGGGGGGGAAYQGGSGGSGNSLEAFSGNNGNVTSNPDPSAAAQAKAAAAGNLDEANGPGGVLTNMEALGQLRHAGALDKTMLAAGTQETAAQVGAEQFDGSKLAGGGAGGSGLGGTGDGASPQVLGGAPGALGGPTGGGAGGGMGGLAGGGGLGDCTSANLSDCNAGGPSGTTMQPVSVAPTWEPLLQEAQKLAWIAAALLVAAAALSALGWATMCSGGGILLAAAAAMVAGVLALAGKIIADGVAMQGMGAGMAGTVEMGLGSILAAGGLLAMAPGGMAIPITAAAIAALVAGLQFALPSMAPSAKTNIQLASYRVPGTSGSPAAAVSSSGGGSAQPKLTGIAPPSAYAAIFAKASARYGVPESFLAAIAETESSFNPNAVSPAGAQGMMQFMPSLSSSLGIDPFNPAEAVPAAAQVLAGYHREFGSWALAAAAYNAGPGAVQQYGGIPPYAQTEAYVPKVMGLAGM